MGEFRLVAAGAGRFRADGPLTFASARGARLLGERLWGDGRGDVAVDCSGIGAADSAGLAVLLDWLAGARRAGRTLLRGV